MQWNEKRGFLWGRYCGQERIIVQGIEVSHCRGNAVQSLLDIKKDSNLLIATIYAPLCNHRKS